MLDLESAALAELARAEGLPFLGLRAITDAAAEEIPDFLAPARREPGPVGVLDALGWLAADPRRLPDLTPPLAPQPPGRRPPGRGLADAPASAEKLLIGLMVEKLNLNLWPGAHQQFFVMEMKNFTD